MASFVTEVLANSGRLEKEDLGTKISRLSRRVEELKGEVCDMINKKYDEFLPSMQSAEDLVTQVHGLVSDVDVLKSRIETEVKSDLKVAVNEFTELKQQLEKNTVILGVLKQLQEFDSAIEKYNCALTGKNYISAARHLEKAHSCLKVLKSRKGCELKLLKSLGIELTVQKQNLLYHLGEEWQQLAVWKLPPSKENSSMEMILKTELHLCSNDETTTVPLLGSVLQAFAILGELNTKLKFFSQLLLNYILKPLVSYPSLHAQMETQQQGVILRFESIETQLEHPPPAEVFIKLRLVFELLHKHLLDVPVEDSPQTGEAGRVVLADVLGEMIWEEISEAIIKDCLVYSIPNNSSKLVQYEEVINATEEFENALKGMNYLKGDATELLKYARNVNAHFASKKCQDVIVMARNLMTSEIHNTVKITPDSKMTVPVLPKSEGSEKMIKKENHLSQEAPGLENDVKLSQHTFALPTCRISESVQKLMELAYQTLSEATASSKPCSIQLFYTVRNIFHLFYDVVPTYHKENLQKLPQLSAIHHNNCMYIAHHLLTLGHQFRYHLPSPLSDGAATFVDMVPGFRRLGTESFLAQMRSQKGDLLERLSNARNFSNMEDEDNYTAAHKAIRQVIHQLSRLGKVWQDVLPVAIYCKAMGTLLNTAIVEMISKITALEDISTEDGERLYTLCRTMIEEGPLLFTPMPEEIKNKKFQEEVPLYVQKWMKFKEQMIILQASLQEIVDRRRSQEEIQDTCAGRRQSRNRKRRRRSKLDNELLIKLIANLHMLLKDDNVNVVKKSILTMTQLYKVALQWVARSRPPSEQQESCWDLVTEMAADILLLLESDNDGIRTHAVKFVESLIVTLSPRTADSEVPKRQEGDISLEQISPDHPFLKYNTLRDVGKQAVKELLKFMAHPAISSINLTAALGSLASIARQRPMFMAEVIQAYETLHANLPPTLAKSQVSSVRKNLKLQLLSVLRHPSSYEYQGPISTLLLALGTNQGEITRHLPPPRDSNRKRAREDGDGGQKKIRTDIPLPDDDDDKDMIQLPTIPAPAPSTQSATDITAEFLRPLLSPENVANLVLISMVYLPDSMPASFQATYTPVESAGTDAQIRHLARLMATQMTAAGIGPGVEQTKDIPVDVVEEENTKPEGLVIKRRVSALTKGQAISVLGCLSEKIKEEEEDGAPLAKKRPEPILPATQIRPSGVGGRKKVFRLKEVTEPLTDVQIKSLKLGAVQRILQAERTVGCSGASLMRMKILARLVTQLDISVKAEVLSHFLSDPRLRLDLALAWLYQEYCEYQSGAGEEGYQECLIGILTGLQERPDQRDGVFTKVVLEAPLLTDSALDVLRKYCEDEGRSYLGMSTLRDLILTRPARQFQYLHLLLDLSSHEKDKIRQQSLHFIKRMYEKESLRPYIEKFALNYLQLLVHPNPPSVLFGADKDTEVAAPWTEDTVKQCLYLYLALLPQNHKLIHELASVYTEATADIKRTVLRVIETPIRGMGMNSPELLLLVENCPKGAETLVTRCLHILTDKVPPSLELVKRVRELYHKRLPDVRFLIPVLNGLDKKEVIQALPKLIKLNPIVVKEVFNRLLGTQHGEVSSSMSPLTPGDLLVALHNIDSSKCDMKSVIKATNLCFSARSVYTSEVLAVVLQQLMDTTPLPMLLMRTVIQALGMYPRLGGFIMNILTRLIYKQVWKYPKVWEGFIKCCQRTKPQSFSVLLQLPPPQLLSVLQTSPDLRDPLLAHVRAFTPHQLAHVPHSIMAILEAESRTDTGAEEAAQVEEEQDTPAQDIIARRLAQEKSLNKLIEEQKGQSNHEMEEEAEVDPPTIFIAEEEEEESMKSQGKEEPQEDSSSNATTAEKSPVADEPMEEDPVEKKD